jgi:hypothetical protein
MVVAGESQIVYGTVALVMEVKDSQFYLLQSSAPLGLVIPQKIIYRLPPAEE